MDIAAILPSCAAITVEAAPFRAHAVAARAKIRGRLVRRQGGIYFDESTFGLEPITRRTTGFSCPMALIMRSAGISEIQPDIRRRRRTSRRIGIAELRAHAFERLCDRGIHAARRPAAGEEL